MPPLYMKTQLAECQSHVPSAQMVYTGSGETPFSAQPPAFLGTQTQNQRTKTGVGSWGCGPQPNTCQTPSCHPNHSSFLTMEALLVGQVCGARLLLPREDFSPGRGFSPSCRDLWVCALALRMCQTHLNPSRGQSLGPWDRSFYLYLPLAQGA